MLWLRAFLYGCLLLILSLGPANSVQIVAWAGMLVRETGQAPVAVALKRTFSGEAPCRMCHAAEQLRAVEQGPPGAPPTTPPGKLDPWFIADARNMQLPLPQSGALVGIHIVGRQPDGVRPRRDEPVPRG
ncbi:MAG TPA: hypothetical protein DCS97_03185 [Planctomycetes bacterium]|nr:hypothetical protein [Planctomycetota bacterium]